MEATAKVLKCTQCAAVLTPAGPFSNRVSCAFCGCTTQLDPTFVSVARFRAALARSEEPARLGFSEWVTVAGAHWSLARRLGVGDHAEAWAGVRARWPSESVVVKISNDPEAQAYFAAERAVLERLLTPPGGMATPPPLWLPEPVACGAITGGAHGGHALIYRAMPRRAGSFEDARRAYPGGVPAPVGVWMWRRILETLAYVHRTGFAHGAVLPPHLSIERGDHGVRLVGFGRAGSAGATARPLSGAWSAFTVDGPLSASADVTMSARAIAWVLGGDPASGAVPASVPAPFAELIASCAASRRLRDLDAWTLRNRVGAIGRASFGPPRFVPLALPEDGR